MRFIIVVFVVIAGIGVACAQSASTTPSVGLPIALSGDSSSFSWRIVGGSTVCFRVPDDQPWEAVVMTLDGRILRHLNSNNIGGWRSLEIPEARECGNACILRIKLGNQLVVAGKVLWPMRRA